MSDSQSEGQQPNLSTEASAKVENKTTPKIYLGNLQEKVRKSNDRFLVGMICLDDIENLPKEHIHKYKSGKRFVKVIINPYRDGANQYGNTHSMAVDTFKPTNPTREE